MERIVVQLAGGTGLPGVSVFYGDPAVPGLKTDLEAFYDAVADLFPNGVSAVVPSNGDLIEDSNGSLAGTWSSGTPQTYTGFNTNVYAAGVGVAVQWNTNGVRNGRRVRGRTFLCPLTSAAFQADGTLDNSARTTLQTAADTLASAGHLLVWSRPESVVAANGDSNLVVSATVPDRVTSLRSRRY